MVTALSQIVDNAAKYSYPESTITIFLEPFPAEVRISVHNIGPAIPSHQLHRLFERFYRSPCFENLSVGTGLGLSVTKKIVEAHGGTVGVQSGMGGTTFYVSLRPEVHIAPVTSEPAQASCA
jgi:signal transduction histidine kinase